MAGSVHPELVTFLERPIATIHPIKLLDYVEDMSELYDTRLIFWFSPRWRKVGRRWSMRRRGRACR